MKIFLPPTRSQLVLISKIGLIGPNATEIVAQKRDSYN